MHRWEGVFGEQAHFGGSAGCLSRETGRVGRVSLKATAFKKLSSNYAGSIQSVQLNGIDVDTAQHMEIGLIHMPALLHPTSILLHSLGSSYRMTSIPTHARILDMRLGAGYVFTRHLFALSS